VEYEQNTPAQVNPDVDSLGSKVLFLLLSHWVWDPSAAAPVRISFLPAEAASGIVRASKFSTRHQRAHLD
jgi:hypothetical protein